MGRRVLSSPLGRSALRGVVTIEMLLGFFPVLFASMGLIQITLLWTAKLVVTHAASRAVRAAVVILDDDPKHYDSAPRGNLTEGQLPASGSLTELWSRANQDFSSLLGKDETVQGARLGAIREAAYHPLSVLAPASLLNNPTLQDELGGPSMRLGGEMQDLPEVRLGPLAWAYNRGASAITVHKGSGGPVVSDVGPRDVVTVRVVYLMKCGVPLLSALLCHSGSALLKADLGLSGADQAERTTEGLKHVESPALLRTLWMTGRYSLITAEASLPNQGAEYHKDG